MFHRFILAIALGLAVTTACNKDESTTRFSPDLVDYILDIATATRLRLSSGQTALMKTLPHAPAGFFEAEASGLRWLAEVDGGLPVPEVLGAALTLVLVNVFPARRARDLLALLALFGAAGLVVLFRLLRPEQLMRPEGFRDLVDFVAALETPQSIWLPSE